MKRLVTKHNFIHQLRFDCAPLRHGFASQGRSAQREDHGVTVTAGIFVEISVLVGSGVRDDVGVRVGVEVREAVGVREGVSVGLAVGASPFSTNCPTTFQSRPTKTWT